MPDIVSTPYMLTSIIIVMIVMREKPETTRKVKEGFTEEAIFNLALN